METLAFNASGKHLYSVKELKEFLPISESSIYAEINRGNIPSVNFGKRKFVPAWYIDKLMKQCEGA